MQNIEMKIFFRNIIEIILITEKDIGLYFRS